MVGRIGAWLLGIDTSGQLDERLRAELVRVYNLVAWVAGGSGIELEETRRSDSVIYQR